MPVVTRGSFYLTISGVAAQAPIRELSRPIVGCLDARLQACRCSKAPEVVLRREEHQERSGRSGGRLKARGFSSQRPDTASAQRLCERALFTTKRPSLCSKAQKSARGSLHAPWLSPLRLRGYWSDRRTVTWVGFRGIPILGP